VKSAGPATILWPNVSSPIDNGAVPPSGPDCGKDAGGNAMKSELGTGSVPAGRRCVTPTPRPIVHLQSETMSKIPPQRR